MAFFDDEVQPGNKAPVKASGGFFDDIAVPSATMPTSSPKVSPQSAPAPKTGGFSFDFKAINNSVPKMPQSTPAVIAPGEGTMGDIKKGAQFVKDIFTGGDDTAGGFTRNFVTGLPKATKDVLWSIPKGMYDQQVNPDPEQKKYEEELLPYAPKSSPVTRVLTAPGVFAARQITRFINPTLRPVANDIAEIVAINEKGGIADQVAEGKIPASVLDEFAVLQKTAPQIVGDVAQAVLTAYSGSAATQLATQGSKQGAKQALIRGFGEGAKIGTVFGGAQAASSGSKDPLELLSIIGTGTAAGGILGAITSGAIPVAHELIPKVREAQLRLMHLLGKDIDGPAKAYNSNPFAKTHGGEPGYTFRELENNILGDNSVGATNYDAAIKAGDLTPDMVYKDPSKKIFQPDRAQAMVSDIQQNINRYKPGLGDEFAKTVDINNTTANGIKSKAIDILDNAHAQLSDVAIRPVAPRIKPKVEEVPVDNLAPKVEKPIQEKAQIENPKTLDTTSEKQVFDRSPETQAIAAPKELTVSEKNSALKKLADPEYDITPKDAENIIRSMFTPEEIKFVHGPDIADLSGITNAALVKNLEGFYRPRSFASDLIGVVEKGGRVSSDTLYHESFHAYLERFTDRNERASVIEYVKKNKITAPARELAYSKEAYPTVEARAEEWLADDFARYVRTKKADARLVSFYQRVLNKIREWIRKKGQLETLYDRILNKDRSVVNSKRRVTLPITSLKLRDENLPERLQRIKLAIEIKEEALNNSPYNNPKNRYLVDREGSVRELGDQKNSKLIKKMEDRIAESGIGDSGEFARGLEKYFKDKQDLVDMKRDFQKQRVDYYASKKKEEIAARDEKALDKMAERTQAKEQKAAYTEEKKASLKASIEEAQKRLADEAAYKSRFKKIVEEANRPSFSGNDNLYNTLKKSLNPVKYLDKETFGYFRDWRRTLLVGKEIANQDAKIFTVPKGEGMQVIHDYQAGKKTQYSEAIKKTFDSLFKEAQSRGLEFQYRDNYLPQVYKETPAEIHAAIVDYMKKKGVDDITIKDYLDGHKELDPSLAKSLKLNPSFTKEKVFPTYAAAEAAGLHAKYENPAQLVGYYRNEMEKTLANRDFMEKLSKEGKILPAELAPRHWEEIKLTLGGDRWYAPKEFAKVINGQIADAQAYGFFDSVVRTVAGLSKKAQEIALSAGVPNSSFNFFTIGQLVKNLTAGDFKAVAPFLRSNFNGASIKYFEKNIDVIKAMAGQGIDLGSRIGNYGELYNTLAKKWGEKDFRGFAGESFDKLFNEKTFGSFMPQLYIQTFKDAMGQAMKHGLEKADAEKFAGETTKAFYGIIEDNGRSIKTQDKLSAIFFAPKFREGVINTLLNTAKSVTTEVRNPMFYKNRRLVAGMAITYAAYNLLNYKLNGNYMWDNENGKEFALKIPTEDGTVVYVEFMPSFLAFARNMGSGVINTFKGDFKTAGQKFGGLFSMPLKISSEVITNRDYFDRPIYKDTDTVAQKATKIAGYTGLAVSHPYIKELLKQSGITQPLFKDALNVPDEKPPLYQSITTALELPLKYSSMDKIQQQQFYDALDKQRLQRAKTEDAFRPTYEAIRKLVKEGKDAEAQAMLDGLSDSNYALYKNMKSGDTRQQTIKNQQDFLPTYNEIQKLKSDGNVEEAQAKLDSLTDDEYKIYDQLRNKFAGASTNTINKGEKPQFEDGKKATDKGLIEVISTYAKAIGSDPVTAFDRIFTGQKIRRVDNGAIIVERMTMDESQAVKADRGGLSGAMKLDHTVPLQLGGSNDESNLKLVPTEEWATYTPVENYLGKELKAGRISKKEAQDLIKRFKAGEIKASDIIK